MTDAFWSAVGIMLICIAVAVPIAIIYLALTDDRINDGKD